MQQSEHSVEARASSNRAEPARDEAEMAERQDEAVAAVVRQRRRGERTCATCRFWVPELADGSAVATGTCKAAPPRVVALRSRWDGAPNTWTCWPDTSADDWCGTWAADEEQR